MLPRSAIVVVMLAGWAGFPQQSQQNQSPDPNQPPAQAKQQQNSKPSPADANPFPEAKSKEAQEAAGPGRPDAKPAPPPNYSSSHVDLKKFDEPEGSASRISDGAGGFIHNPELAAHDDKIGNFYLQTGDFQGAYDRFKEAAEVAPEDADAVFGLAESARGLKRTQEAVVNYRLYLDAFPDGKRAKEARKALATMAEPKKR